jgi:hypothetical protein
LLLVPQYTLQPKKFIARGITLRIILTETPKQRNNSHSFAGSGVTGVTAQVAETLGPTLDY